MNNASAAIAGVELLAELKPGVAGALMVPALTRSSSAAAWSPACELGRGAIAGVLVHELGSGAIAGVLMHELGRGDRRRAGVAGVLVHELGRGAIAGVLVHEVGRNAQTLVMPLEQGWPSVQCGPWQIDYDPALRPAYVEERIAYATSLDFSGLQGYVVDLTRLAKLHRCDTECFFEALVAANRHVAITFVRAAQRRAAQSREAGAALTDRSGPAYITPGGGTPRMPWCLGRRGDRCLGCPLSPYHGSRRDRVASHRRGLRRGLVRGGARR